MVSCILNIIIIEHLSAFMIICFVRDVSIHVASPRILLGGTSKYNMSEVTWKTARLKGLQQEWCK